MFRNKVWNTVIFREPKASFSLEGPKFDTPVLSLLNNGLRREVGFRHTTADPFLIGIDDELFLFAETKCSFSHGKISAWCTKSGTDWKTLGEVLSTNHHASYPFVTSTNNEIVMIPEMGKSGELTAWTTDNFPFAWSERNKFLDGKFCDSSVIKWQGSYFLFACPEIGEHLEIYHSKTIDGPWIPHVKNPVVRGRARARNGGGPIIWQGNLYRFAQNCTNTYGEKLALMKITELTASSYSESIVDDDFLPRNKPWNRHGGHHFSMTDFGPFVYYAVDGLSLIHI